MSATEHDQEQNEWTEQEISYMRQVLGLYWSISLQSRPQLTDDLRLSLIRTEVTDLRARQASKLDWAARAIERENRLLAEHPELTPTRNFLRDLQSSVNCVKDCIERMDRFLSKLSLLGLPTEVLRWDPSLGRMS